MEKRINEGSKIKDEYNYENREEVPEIEKRLGDEQLKLDNRLEASKHYSKAIMAIKLLNDDPDINKAKIKDLITKVGLPSNLNMSLIALRNNDMDAVIFHTNKVLEVDNTHVKALYRRCLAYINKNNFQAADEDLQVLEDLIGGSKELEELEEKFEKRKKEYKSKEDVIYKKMFKKYVRGKINNDDKVNRTAED